MAGGEGDNDCCKTIVGTVPGQGTGETLYKTSDGRLWKRIDGMIFDGGTTAKITGWYRDGKICNHR